MPFRMYDTTSIVVQADKNNSICDVYHRMYGCNLLVVQMPTQGGISGPAMGGTGEV